jgi:CubicO group peptidase (beta-lactamase class C family)
MPHSRWRSSVRLLWLLACLPWLQAAAQPLFSGFEQTLVQYQARLRIPGINALVLRGDSIVYHKAFGFADVERNMPLQTTHAFPVASITKTFAATLALQCVAQGKFALTDTLTRLLPEQKDKLDDRILVRHILGHTSELAPGTEFNYSGRYGLIKDVVEKATGKPFATLVAETFIQPLGMAGTQPGLGKPGYETQWGNVVAGYGVRQKPYHMEYVPHTDSGLSANTGLVSTTGDLARYFIALKNGRLLDKIYVAQLWQPPTNAQQPLPVGLAWFTRTVASAQGTPVRVAWSFGQLGNVSSLLMTVPERDYTLIMLANSPAMTDAFRLIEGDAVFSPFVQAFWRTIGLLPAAEGKDNAAAVSDFFVEGYTQSAATVGIKQTVRAYRRNPLYTQGAPHLGLLAAAMQQGIAKGGAIHKMARTLVRLHPQNPKHVYFAANYYLQQGYARKARKAAGGIDGWQNVQRSYFSAGCYLAAAEAYMKKDKARAQGYLNKVLEWSYYADQTTRAKALLAQLQPTAKR